jgi:hypothetical protein
MRTTSSSGSGACVRVDCCARTSAEQRRQRATAVESERELKPSLRNIANLAGVPRRRLNPPPESSRGEGDKCLGNLTQRGGWCV